VPTVSLRHEQALLEAARGGDERAFRRFVEPHRDELHAHCYRMLGSVHDAEDAVQDALLRAWRGLRRFEGRSSRRTWLYKIATNACLDEIARRPKRVLPAGFGPATPAGEGPGAPLVESIWIEPYPDQRLADVSDAPGARYEQREAIELAFVAALQHLPARQRAVLVLREVLGFSAKETAELLDTTPQSVNSALQRARRTLDERAPDASQQTSLRALGDDAVRELVERYADAWERGDVDTIVAMLAEDVLVTMPPMATWYEGRDAAAYFLREVAFAHRWEEDRFVAGERRVRLLPARAAAQPALASYTWREEEGAFMPMAIQVLWLRGDRIGEIDGFVFPRDFPLYGLPERLT
jgi:RNA polymerase sigma-70 factor (ECF subfamily)